MQRTSYNNNLGILFIDNFTHYNDNLTLLSSISNELLLNFLDRSQLIMTIVGVIANIGTSITLIKNGQVGKALTKIK